jgi:hypothetical protein
MAQACANAWFRQQCETPRCQVHNDLGMVRGPKTTLAGLVAFVLVGAAAASIYVAANLRVEIRNSEVWLIRNGVAKQLTNDQKAKLQAILSPSQDRVAYYNQCPRDEHCTPSIVILDLEGKSVRSFEPRGEAQGGACGSIFYIWWTEPGMIAADCHINPSLSEYVETDLLTGKTTRDLLGYWFKPSADGRRVAHVGWIPHFAPPFAHSNYLQLTI